MRKNPLYGFADILAGTAVQRPCFHAPACQGEPAALQTLIHQSILAPDSMNLNPNQEKYIRDLACLEETWHVWKRGRSGGKGGERRTKHNRCIFPPVKGKEKKKGKKEIEGFQLCQLTRKCEPWKLSKLQLVWFHTELI